MWGRAEALSRGSPGSRHSRLAGGDVVAPGSSGSDFQRGGTGVSTPEVPTEGGLPEVWLECADMSVGAAGLAAGLCSAGLLPPESWTWESQPEGPAELPAPPSVGQRALWSGGDQLRLRAREPTTQFGAGGQAATRLSPCSQWKRSLAHSQCSHASKQC